jgi:cytochrome c556
MPRKAIFLILSLPLFITACSEPADTHPGQPVTQRRAAFKEIIKNFEPMGVQLRKDRYDAKQFLVHAKALDSLKEGPWSHFGPDTNYPPTKAKAAIWSEPEKFAENRQAFLKVVASLVVAAESSDVKQVSTAYEALHNTCSTCHKAFRE